MRAVGGGTGLKEERRRREGSALPPWERGGRSDAVVLLWQLIEKALLGSPWRQCSLPGLSMERLGRGLSGSALLPGAPFPE